MSTKSPVHVFVEALQSNAKAIVGGLAAVVVVGLTILMIDVMNKRAEQAAFAEFYKIEKQMTQIQKVRSKDLKEGEQLENTPEAFEKHFKDTAELTLKFIKENQGRAAAALSAMNLAEVYETHNLPEKALGTLQLIEAELKKDSVTYPLFKLQLGRLLIDNEKLDEAKKHLQDIIDTKKHEAMQPIAMLNLGVAYYKGNDIDKAETIFKQVIQDYSDKAVGKDAQVYLNVIALKKEKSS